MLCPEEALDPAAVPIYWVSRWVDYSDKYGLGYQLCDNSIGVLFNDCSRLLLTSNAEYTGINYTAFPLDIGRQFNIDGCIDRHNLRRSNEDIKKLARVLILSFFIDRVNI